MGTGNLPEGRVNQDHSNKPILLRTMFTRLSQLSVQTSKLIPEDFEEILIMPMGVRKIFVEACQMGMVA